jgi:uncharacterized protein (TIGR02147 family)
MKQRLPRKITVFDYHDYRLYLRDWYESKKAADPSITHRLIAERVGFNSSGFFSQVLQGQSNISAPTAKHFADFTGPAGEERAYFLVLVRYNQAKTGTDKQRFFRELLTFRKGAVAMVEAGNYEFYSQWYHTAVREAIALMKTRNDRQSHILLSRMIIPRIKPLQVKKSLQLIERLGMISVGTDGFFKRTDRLISTGTEASSVMIANFARQALDLAKNALVRLPRAERSISCVTLSLTHEGYREIEQRLQLLRRELLEIADRQHGVDRIYQVNFQAFPLTRRNPKKTRSNELR